MVEVLGWVSTGFVLIGFYLNAVDYKKLAMLGWVMGDAGWICYDFMIDNYSHFTLSLVIIVINAYGFYRLQKNK